MTGTGSHILATTRSRSSPWRTASPLCRSGTRLASARSQVCSVEACSVHRSGRESEKLVKRARWFLFGPQASSAPWHLWRCIMWRPDHASLMTADRQFSCESLTSPPPKQRGPCRHLHCGECGGDTDGAQVPAVGSHVVPSHQGQARLPAQPPGFVLAVPLSPGSAEGVCLHEGKSRTENGLPLCMSCAQARRMLWDMRFRSWFLASRGFTV